MTSAIDHLAGDLRFGYSTSEISKTFYQIEQSAAGAVHLWCLWESFDEDTGFTGDSDFYISASDGQMHEVSSQFACWLLLRPGDPEAPAGPGDPDSWFGAAASDVDLERLICDGCNAAQEGPNP